MFQSSVFFLPSVISLLWLASFLFKVKNDRQVLFTWLLAANIFYYATYAFYISPYTDYKIMVMLDAINVPVIPTILAMIVVYFYMHIHNTKLNPLQLLLLAPALVMGTIANLLYYLIGFDNAALLTEMLDKDMPIPDEFKTSLYQIFEYFNFQFLGAVCIIFFAVIVMEVISILRKHSYPLGNSYRFLFRKGKTTPARAIALLVCLSMLCMLPLTLLGRTYMMFHPVVGMVTTTVIAVAMHCVAHIEYYSDNQKEITLYYLSHLKLGGENEENQGQPSETEETTPLPSHTSARIRLIQEQLKKLLEEEKIYKDEDLTLNHLAERFGIGRTTLSQMIASQYGMPFRDLLNSYRIEAAKQFMLANPTATQEVIAYECGFKNASYLNAKFKDVVGETPLMWLNKQAKQSTIVM